MTTESDGLTDQRDLVAHRAEFVDLLHERGPLETRDIVEALDHSRSTVTRALRSLRDADLVEKTGDGYIATLPAILLADQYHQYETASKAILSSKDLLEPIPEAHAPSVELLVGANITRADTEVPVRAFEAVSDRIRDSDSMRVYLPTLVNTHLLRVWHRAVVTGSVESTLIAEPELQTVLKGQYPQLLAEMAATDEFTAFSTPGPPYAVVLTTIGDTTTVAVIIYEEDTGVRGVLINESSAAVEWAEAKIDQLKSEATDVTTDLEALSTTVTDGMSTPHGGQAHQHSLSEVIHQDEEAQHALPLDLEAEGFVHLTEEYFATHSQAAPEMSWRTGFTLPDMHAGHAVDRLDDEGQPLGKNILEQLREDHDHVVLGPPGSGKSTICMMVACDWYDRDLGPVLYREHGAGDHFKSPALLEAYLRQADGHALVVVEDAIRIEANAIFDVMQALGDTRNVTFLLDARTNEWRNPDEMAIDPRRDAYRQTAIDQVTVPELDEHECERFVAHFTDLVDSKLEVTGAELFSVVQEGTPAAENDSVPVGDAMVAQHYLVRRHKPPVDADTAPATTLDEATRHMYQRFTDADARFAPDLAVLVSLLTAAGLPVADEYLYTIASPDAYAEIEEALSVLEGQLLFESSHPRAGSPMTYRTRHETWALNFLEQVRALELAQHARERFGQCVTRLLALADAPQQRQQIKQHLGGRTPHLHQIEANPSHWADETVERIFSVGQTDASLAPLFGETPDDTIELPETCSWWTEVQQAYWRGEMHRLHGDLDRAEREYRTLRERAESIETADAERLTHTAAGSTRHDGHDGGEPSESAQRTYWRATSVTCTGVIARMRGEFEAAIEYHEKGLALYRELDDRRGEAKALKNLGIDAWHRGKFEAAAEYHEEALELCRELGDRKGETMNLHGLGLIARERGEWETAAEHADESLARFREFGNQRGEAAALVNRGMVARERGEWETAAEYQEEALALFREVGNRHGEGWTLHNLGLIARERGEWETAAEYQEEALALFREVGIRHGEARALDEFGLIVHERGEVEKASEYHEEARDLCRELGARRDEAKTLNHLGEIARKRGEFAHARSLFAEAADRSVTVGAKEAVTALTNVIDICERQGDIEAALDWCEQAIEFAEETEQEDLHEEFRNRHVALTDIDEA